MILAGFRPRICFRAKPPSYRSCPIIGALFGPKRDHGRPAGNADRAVAAPATVSGEPRRAEPLENPASGRPGRQHVALTREPGDLPVMRVAS